MYFTDLNKTYLNDPNPLLHINKLIDATLDF